jgi:hypothetical protein
MCKGKKCSECTSFCLFPEKPNEHEIAIIKESNKNNGW